MQVKRRINQFFGNILRKDKIQLKDEQEPSTSSSSQVKNKQKNKSNQSYSQWDLIEHIAKEPVEDESSIQKRSPHSNADKMIVSDGLAKYTGGASEEDFNLVDLYDDDMELRMNNNEDFGKKRKSFLKRSGSLLRRSLRRSKRKAGDGKENDFQMPAEKSESLTGVVRDINETLLAVAAFGEQNYNQVETSDTQQNIYPNREIIFESDGDFARNMDAFGFFSSVEESCSTQIQETDEELNPQNEKKITGLKNGLKRQASKLASKFQRNNATTGSVRLKPTFSMESLPNTSRNKSASFSTNLIVDDDALPGPSPNINPDLKRTSSFKRKLSFKQAKKVMRKGASSFGKSMMHASAVMPIAYESPPVTFYPDYDEDEYPSHLAQCYYKTISYQPKDGINNNWHDKAVLGHHQQQHGNNYARPTSFYQHGYCYNG